MKQFRLILRPVAVTLIVQSFFMVICGGAALYYGEMKSLKAFSQTVGIVLAAAFVLYALSKSRRGNVLSIRSGFLLVVMVWIFVAFAGSLPYILSGGIPRFADAFFESMSGFTTAGGTVLSDIEALPNSILLWRGFTHWLGGGGIIVLSVAILPLLGIGGAHMMKAETSGVMKEKLTPRITETAKYIWILYICLTVILVGLLMFGGMSLLDALCNGFSAISTGGLSNKNASIGYFHSAYIDWVITVFMLLGATNFVLLIKVARGNLTSIVKDSEFKTYIVIFIASTACVTFFLYGNRYDSWSEALRYGAFQVASIFSTTGFATDDYELWPAAAQAVIFMLFFIGGCSGSTSGGVKVVRYTVMIKRAFTELKSLVHPKGVFTIRLNGAAIGQSVFASVMGFFILYLLTVMAATIAVAASGLDLFSSFTATLGCIGTIGPGFGALGPSKNYGFLPDYVKYILSFVMLVGRLEVYTIFILFTPWFWKK